MFASAVEPRVFRGLVIEEAALGALAVRGRLTAFVGGVGEEMAPLALVDRFGLPGDADRDRFPEEEVAGFDNLFDLGARVVEHHDRHRVRLSGGVFHCASGPQGALNY